MLEDIDSSLKAVFEERLEVDSGNGLLLLCDRDPKLSGNSRPIGRNSLTGGNMTNLNTRQYLLLAALIGITAIAGFSGLASAQVKTRLSIATGGTGGVYYPLGGGLAALISKHIPGVEATAEVTTASVDNMKLLHADRVALAFTLPDSALEAYQGQLKGLKEKIGFVPSPPSTPTTCT